MARGGKHRIEDRECSGPLRREWVAGYPNVRTWHDPEAVSKWVLGLPGVCHNLGEQLEVCRAGFAW